MRISTPLSCYPRNVLRYTDRCESVRRTAEIRLNVSYPECSTSTSSYVGLTGVRNEGYKDCLLVQHMDSKHRASSIFSAYKNSCTSLIEHLPRKHHPPCNSPPSSPSRQPLSLPPLPLQPAPPSFLPVRQNVRPDKFTADGG